MHLPSTFCHYLTHHYFIYAYLIVHKNTTAYALYSIRTRYRGATLVNNTLFTLTLLKFKILDPIRLICSANLHHPLAFYLLQIILSTSFIELFDILIFQYNTKLYFICQRSIINLLEINNMRIKILSCINRLNMSSFKRVR